ncbi:uncharacterized protein LOC121697034 [Alosa sapidissima]|uniref:uncharacterized protein LOC121697034 n=1 Tax=Alosa sapidissima TaxID=34773 RepID=UPI001C0A5AD3|nr:uncharacterized protein LOC121697034 [Alosa sapidissima]
MPSICCAVGCSNKKGDPNVSFYRLPKDEDRRQRWLAGIKRAGWTPPVAVDFAVHVLSLVGKAQTLCAPTLFQPYFPLSSPDKRKRIYEMRRFEHTQALKRKRAVSSVDRGETGIAGEEGLETCRGEDIHEMDKDDRQEFDREDRQNLDGQEDGEEFDRDEELQDIFIGDAEESDREEEGQETDRAVELETGWGVVSGRSCGNASCEHTIKCLMNECMRLQREVYKLKDQVSSLSFNQESLKDKDEKVQKLTGLPYYAKLILLFSFISPFLKSKSCLSPFQQFLLTVMRLRMKLPLFFCSLFVSCLNINCWSNF